jgi:hypothetical protein
VFFVEPASAWRLQILHQTRDGAICAFDERAASRGVPDLPGELEVGRNGHSLRQLKDAPTRLHGELVGLEIVDSFRSAHAAPQCRTGAAPGINNLERSGRISTPEVLPG